MGFLSSSHAYFLTDDEQIETTISNTSLIISTPTSLTTEFTSNNNFKDVFELMKQELIVLTNITGDILSNKNLTYNMNYSLLKLDKEINGLMVIILNNNNVTFSQKTNDYFTAAYLVNETERCLQKIHQSLDFLQQQNTFSDFIISTTIMPDSSKSQEKDGTMLVQILISINDTFSDMKTKLEYFSQPVETDGMLRVCA